MTDDDLKFLTPQEVADGLAVPRSKVYALCKSGLLDSITLPLSNQRRIRVSAYKAFIAKNADGAA